MGAGAICLGLTFARLARIAPATGGPYAYSRMAYGDFVGFLIAWGYWISIWASLPVIAVAFTGAVVNSSRLSKDAGRRRRDHACRDLGPRADQSPRRQGRRTCSRRLRPTRSLCLSARLP